MKQKEIEDKQLLLVDLCSRLPYEVCLIAPNNKATYYTDGNTGAEILVEEGWKPYLRSMDKMSESERNEYLSTKMQECERVALAEVRRPEAISVVFDWLNSHHFDYRGLIEKGLAIEAPEDMYTK